MEKDNDLLRENEVELKEGLKAISEQHSNMDDVTKLIGEIEHLHQALIVADNTIWMYQQWFQDRQKIMPSFDFPHHLYEPLFVKSPTENNELL